MLCGCVCSALETFRPRAGNFGFGISEHIDLGVKYDPAADLLGTDFCVVLGRRSNRVARRKHATALLASGRNPPPHKRGVTEVVCGQV